MSALQIPPSGLRLRHEPDPNSERKRSSTAEPPQVIRLELAENVAKQLLRALRNKEKTLLKLGKKPAVQYGKNSITLGTTETDSFPADIYSRSSSGDGPYYFSGRLSHTLEVQRAQEATVRSDEALAALESTLKTIQQERKSNETGLVRTKDELKQGARKDNKPSPLMGQSSALRKDHLLGGMVRSNPSSPFLKEPYSPNLGPTSMSLSSAAGPTKEKIRLDAMRIPLVHLLAARPMSAKAAADTLHASTEDCEAVMDKVARDSKEGAGAKELKEKSFRELDVWKFPYKSQEERQAAIDRAIQAYDRLRIERSDPLWQLLLPEADRNKGKVLSRLNFGKPLPIAKPERHGDENNDSKPELSDREPSKSKGKKEGATLTKKAKERTQTGVKPGPKPKSTAPAKSKDTVAKPSPTKQEGKFKSAERIEDSDEEAEGVPVVKEKGGATIDVKRRQDDGPKPGKPSQSQVTTSPKKTVHKASLSSSSSGSSSNGNGGGSGSERPKHNLSSAGNALKPRQKAADNSASRISPRARTDSSPQKPSPLGSSPPTTATDLDNTGSSKASNQSSAPSSPPSSTDMPKFKEGKTYSPVISDKSRNVSRGRSPVKRKAGPPEDEPAPKRQLQDTPKLSQGNSDPPKRAVPTRTSTTSSSDRSISPEKPEPKKEDVMEEAKRFQKFYKRYKDLHDKISLVDEKDRDEKDMANLWKMHRRLKEMKSEIWSNWGKVEKVEKPLEASREMIAV